MSTRRWGIGGHDTAAILGVSPWRSALQVWGEKTGRIPKVDISNEPYVKRGVELEPHLLAMYSSVTGRKVEEVPPYDNREPWPTGCAHPEFPHVVAPLDGLTQRANGDHGPVDAKTTTHWKIDDWGDKPDEEVDRIVDPATGEEIERPKPSATKVPLHLEIQAQHYCWVTGAPFASFAVGVVDDNYYQSPRWVGNATVLMGLLDFRWCDRQRNNDFIEVMEKRVLEFIQYVVEDEQPPWEPTAKDRDFMAEILGAETPGESTELGDAGIELVEEVHLAMTAMEEAEARKKTAEAKLMKAMGKAEIGVLPGVKQTVKFKMRKGYEVGPKEGYVVQPKRTLYLPRRKKVD